jgi:hypothetical protein
VLRLKGAAQPIPVVRKAGLHRRGGLQTAKSPRPAQSHGYAQTPLAEGIAPAGSRRIRGSEVQTILAAFPPAHANRREIKKWWRRRPAAAIDRDGARAASPSDERTRDLSSDRHLTPAWPASPR